MLILGNLRPLSRPRGKAAAEHGRNLPSAEGRSGQGAEEHAGELTQTSVSPRADEPTQAWPFIGGREWYRISDSNR